MRRVLERLRSYAVELVRHGATGWNQFWFTPQVPTILGVIRIFTGLMLLYTHAVWGLELQGFLGPGGWMGAEATHTLQQGQFIFSYLWYVPADWLRVAHGLAMIILVLFTVGLFTRVTSVLSFVVLINYAHRAPAALFGLDQINALLTLYLAIGPSGAAWSADRLWVRYRMARRALERGSTAKGNLEPTPSVGANVAIRLIQVHMCVIYFFAGLSKLLGEAWWDGTAIWRAVASYEYQSADLTWLAFTPLSVNLLTHLTAFWELSYCALIWPRLTRPLVLAGAVAMHLGIGLFMGMMTFGLIMLVANISFVPPRLLHELAVVRRRRSITILYDGACSLCIRSMSWIKAFDIADQIRVVDFNQVEPAAVHPLLTYNACLGEMQVIHEVDGRAGVFSGYWGFRIIARRLRLLWPLVPLFSLPGASQIGPRVYRAIARSRARRLGCYPGACGIHSGETAAQGVLDREPLYLTIRLPPDAKLFIQGELIPGTGRKRVFTSRPARPGKDYVFDVKVEVERDGVKLTMGQEVHLRAGDRSAIRFRVPEIGSSSTETASEEPPAALIEAGSASRDAASAEQPPRITDLASAASNAESEVGIIEMDAAWREGESEEPHPAIFEVDATSGEVVSEEPHPAIVEVDAASNEAASDERHPAMVEMDAASSEAASEEENRAIIPAVDSNQLCSLETLEEVRT